MRTISHYVPAYCEHRIGTTLQREYKAVCGVWVTPDQHATEPRCSDCRIWLAADVQPSGRVTETTA